MLPELSLLHEGSCVSLDPPRLRTIPTRAPHGTPPERAASNARSASDVRLAVRDLQPLVVGRAPRWSILALQREVELQQRVGHGPHDPGLMFRVLGPVAVGAATVVGLVALGGMLLALGLVAAVALAFTVVTRLRVTRRWCDRQRLLQLDNDAMRLRSRLVSKLHREHRDELECLVGLVENVREHEAVRFGARRASSTLVARLDALLLSYVERAIEVRGVAAGFAVTLDDEPKLLEPAAALEPDLAGDPERRRALQILHLRRRAREMCRRRIERMERELACIGQLVRLVHEQALASALTHDELQGLLADVLDEAEHTRQAREEAEATLDERALRSEPLLAPTASASLG